MPSSGSHYNKGVQAYLLISVFFIFINSIKTLDVKIQFFSVALRSNAGHCLLIQEVSRSHTTTQHSR